MIDAAIDEQMVAPESLDQRMRPPEGGDESQTPTIRRTRRRTIGELVRGVGEALGLAWSALTCPRDELGAETPAKDAGRLRTLMKRIGNSGGPLGAWAKLLFLGNRAAERVQPENERTSHREAAGLPGHVTRLSASASAKGRS